MKRATARDLVVSSMLVLAIGIPTRVIADEADDEWDTDSGPVEKGVRISGVMGASARATFFTTDPTEISEYAKQREVTFQIGHVHLKFVGDLTSKLSFEIMPCLTHMERFSVITAFFEWQPKTAFNLKVGRFLVPFGGFNERSLPASYPTSSRPLAYQSHNDRYIQYDIGTPSTVLFTPREDIGALVSGSLWLGKRDFMQIWYGAYAINGFNVNSNTMLRMWEDNNNYKGFGGRLSVAMELGKIDIAIGGSILWNRYDEDRDQLMWGVDGELGIRWKRGRRLTIRGEYVDSHREIIPTEELASGDESYRSWYVGVDTMFTEWLGIFGQFDHLANRLPDAQLNEEFHDDLLVTNRILGGVTLAPTGALQIKFEYSFWDEAPGLPDAHRVVVQPLVTF